MKLFKHRYGTINLEMHIGTKVGRAGHTEMRIHGVKTNQRATGKCLRKPHHAHNFGHSTPYDAKETRYDGRNNFGGLRLF